jgi:hypothetical protein
MARLLFRFDTVGEASGCATLPAPRTARATPCCTPVSAAPCTARRGPCPRVGCACFPALATSKSVRSSSAARRAASLRAAQPCRLRSLNTPGRTSLYSEGAAISGLGGSPGCPETGDLQHMCRLATVSWAAATPCSGGASNFGDGLGLCLGDMQLTTYNYLPAV